MMSPAWIRIITKISICVGIVFLSLLGGAITSILISFMAIVSENDAILINRLGAYLAVVTAVMSTIACGISLLSLRIVKRYRNQVMAEAHSIHKALAQLQQGGN
jgi:hypothetical protein